MSAMASQINSVASVCLTVGSGGDQRKHQSSASLAFVWGIHRWPVNSPHKWRVTRKMFSFDDVIMWEEGGHNWVSISWEPFIKKITSQWSYCNITMVILHVKLKGIEITIFYITEFLGWEKIFSPQFQILVKSTKSEIHRQEHLN